jgi:hypothetical protein
MPRSVVAKQGLGRLKVAKAKGARRKAKELKPTPVHQAIGMHLPASLRAGLAEYSRKLSVLVVAKNRLPAIAPVQEMIKSTLVFDSDLAGHDVDSYEVRLWRCQQ